MAVQVTQHPDFGRCARISNDRVEMLVTLDVAPRIILYALIGGENVFAELPHAAVTVDNRTWRPLGGHRLWTTPEEIPGSYTVDESPVQYETALNAMLWA